MDQLTAPRETIRKLRLSSRIKPLMYAMCSTMYEKNCIVFARTRVRQISYVACGFRSVKIHYSVNRINEIYIVVFFLIKYRYSDILLKRPKLRLWHLVDCCNQLLRCNLTFYCIGMVSLASSSRYVTLSPRYECDRK